MSYGKFSSAENLLEGYNQLEKSFTQKCQQVAELSKKLQQLEQAVGAQTAQPPQVEQSEAESVSAQPQVEAVAQTLPDGTSETSSPSQQLSSEAADDQSAQPQPTQQQLLQYLQQNPSVAQTLAAQALPSVMKGGGNVSLAAPSRPRTIKEASLMARKLFE